MGVERGYELYIASNQPVRVSEMERTLDVLDASAAGPLLHAPFGVPCVCVYERIGQRNAGNATEDALIAQEDAIDEDLRKQCLSATRTIMEKLCCHLSSFHSLQESTGLLQFVNKTP